MDHYRKRKLKLYSEDRCCCYCGKETTIYDHRDHWNPPDDEATIEHIYCKIDKRRYEQDFTIPRTKLACRKCNNLAGVFSKKLIDVKTKKFHNYTITVKDNYEKELCVKLQENICPYIRIFYNVLNT